jgi:hypothetical protein
LQADSDEADLGLLPDALAVDPAGLTTVRINVVSEKPGFITRSIRYVYTFVFDDHSLIAWERGEEGGLRPQ